MFTDREWYRLAYNLIEEPEKVVEPSLMFFTARSKDVGVPPPYEFDTWGSRGGASYDESRGVMVFCLGPYVDPAYEAKTFYEQEGYLDEELKESIIASYGKFFWAMTHEFTHYEQHARAGWDKDKAFPPESFKLPYRERPFEKEAWPIGEKWERIMERTLHGEETELSSLVKQIARS